MTAKLRFRIPPAPYKWLPTAQELEHSTLTALVEYELLYITTLILLSPPCFLLGYILGLLWLKVS